MRYLAEALLQPQVFLVWCNQLCTSAFGNYLPFFSWSLPFSSSVRLDEGWQTFSGFSRNIPLGSLQFTSKLSTSHSCCVLRAIVLLEGEPSVQSEVLNALDWVFIKAISIFWCIELFFYSDESLSPCHWKTAPQHEAATSTLYLCDGTLQVMSRAGFLQT